MAAPSQPADPRAIVRALEGHRVAYVVIGGWAAVTYGVDRATFDLDVIVAGSDENARALAGALGELNARRDLGAGVTEPLEISGAGFLTAGPLRALTSAGPLDVLTRAPGAGSYEDLRADARRASFGDGTGFVIASKASLEAIKEAIAAEADPVRGDRDRRDLEELRALPDPDLPPA
jgi:hypothetical protein